MTQLKVFESIIETKPLKVQAPLKNPDFLVYSKPNVCDETL